MAKKSNTTMIIIIVVAIAVIAALAYFMWPKPSEPFSGAFDPSTRVGLFGLGPTQEGFCANCQ